MMDVQVEKDLVFAAHDGSDLGLTLPSTSTGHRTTIAPVTIYVHGGGWRHDDKTDDGARRLAPLSACGITVVAANYRLSPCDVPRQLHDLKGAVRWLQGKEPRLGLPTGRIGI